MSRFLNKYHNTPWKSTPGHHPLLQGCTASHLSPRSQSCVLPGKIAQNFVGESGCSKFAKCHRHCLIPASQQRRACDTLSPWNYYVWLPQHNRQSQSFLRTRDQRCRLRDSVLNLQNSEERLPPRITKSVALILSTYGQAGFRGDCVR